MVRVFARKYAAAVVRRAAKYHLSVREKHMSTSLRFCRLSFVVVLSAGGLAACGAADGIQTPGEPGESTDVVAEPLTGFAVTTRAYNSNRTGANTGETALTPSNVALA